MIAQLNKTTQFVFLQYPLPKNVPSILSVDRLADYFCTAWFGSNQWITAGVENPAAYLKIGVAMYKTIFALFMVTTAIAGNAAAICKAEEPTRISWEGWLIDGFKTACKEKKPLVVFFHKDYCSECKGRCRHCAPIEELLACPEVTRLTDRAVWVWQTVGVDDTKGNAEKLMKDLGVERVPAIFVLEVSADRIEERARIVGSTSKEDLVKTLTDHLLGKVTVDTDKSADLVPSATERPLNVGGTWRRITAEMAWKRLTE